MAQNQIKDLDFDVSESMLDPFKGTVTFTVQTKIKIVNFEFSTHEMGCSRTDERSVKYGLKLTVNGKILFTYHNNKVDVEVIRRLILTPGNTYKLETWLSGHAKSNTEAVRSCTYHYAQITRYDKTNYEPFEFVFPENEDEDAEPSNKTCVYIMTYEMIN